MHRAQGRRNGFLSGVGRIVGRWPTYPQNTLKIGKGTAFGPFHSRIWRKRPLLNLSLEGTRPLRPPAFDAHDRATDLSIFCRSPSGRAGCVCV